VPRRNLIGLEVGDLKVVGHWFAETWACRCSCGREALVHADDLVKAQMRSYGCKPGTRRPQRRPGFTKASKGRRTRRNNACSRKQTPRPKARKPLRTVCVFGLKEKLPTTREQAA
jgi:hypothetical protein